MIARLLRKNTSPARIAGFVLSNFIGLAIVLGGLQFYLDARSIWQAEDSFVSSDYLVINKKVTSADMLGDGSSDFSESEIADLESQPWVRKTGRFSSNDYRVYAAVGAGQRKMSSYMFFEAIPDGFIDVARGQWAYRPGSDEVPLIMSKDYLTLYNFGFASSAGLPRLSEGLMGSIPLELTLTSEDGARTRSVHGRVVGFSNRLNTILVPQSFIDETNSSLGSGVPQRPSRLIVDVSSPGDVAISKYMDQHDYEIAGDKSASSASFLLRLVTGIVLAVGGVITILSFFILLLSISLIMEKNRSKIHTLLMLGYRVEAVARPYNVLIVIASGASLVLAFVGLWLMRAYYLEPLKALGAEPGQFWITPVVGMGMTLLIMLFNFVAVRRRVTGAFRI